MLGISSPQTYRPGTTGTIRIPPVKVVCLHCCTLKTKVDSYWPYQFNVVKEKTRLRYKPWAAIKSSLKPIIIIAKITLTIIFKFLIFLIWTKTLFCLHLNKYKFIFMSSWFNLLRTRQKQDKIAFFNANVITNRFFFSRFSIYHFARNS